MGVFDNILSITNNYISYILIVFLIVAGLYFSIKTRFVQFRLLPDAIKSLKEKSDGKKVSSFEALMISTASRVGTGNIAGVAAAIILGGPGSVFWMWLMAMIGAASAFVESTLAQIYKIKDGDTFRGGPSYYMQKALGKKWLGLLFAFIFTICFAYAFNALQSFMISSSFEHYVQDKVDDYSHSIYPIIVGIILVILTAVIIFGGVHRIGFVTSYLVPIMAIAYIVVGLYITCINVKLIPNMFKVIIRDAFDFKSIFSGFIGSSLMLGIKKGLFSNEAGMGSAPNAAASADTSHPVKQGMVQVISVFIDTILICTTTAFMVLLSGAPLDGSMNGIPFVQLAISKNIGDIGNHFVTISVFLFAFSSVIGNYCYAESNILFINKSKILLNVFRCTCLVAVFVGALSEFETVWNFAEVLMALMAIINIITIFVIGKTSFNALKDYLLQKKEGKDPVFYAEKIGLHNTDVWK